jgi:hypothetical protein
MIRNLRYGRAAGAALLLAGVLAGCATLQNLVQAPRFSVAPGRQAELRLAGPSLGSPLGGATVRIWARVENPNAVGINLTRLDGNLFLEDARAADVSLPLGLPLLAQRDTVVPLDITLALAELPGLAGVARKVLGAGAVAYRLDGAVTVDAGPLGPLSFERATLVRGEVAVRR